MSVNRFLPHVLVLPEDRANRQIANGFHLDISSIRRMQVLEEVGGWSEVLGQFVSDHVIEMERNVNRYLILLIDFDGREERLTRAQRDIPEHLADRVFVIGALTTPEDLRQKMDCSYETIGSLLAQDCRDNTQTTWGQELLRHNEAELDRMRVLIRPILF